MHKTDESPYAAADITSRLHQTENKKKENN